MSSPRAAVGVAKLNLCAVEISYQPDALPSRGEICIKKSAFGNSINSYAVNPFKSNATVKFWKAYFATLSEKRKSERPLKYGSKPFEFKERRNKGITNAV